jgi:hypothetical protein
MPKQNEQDLLGDMGEKITEKKDQEVEGLWEA